MSPAVDVIVDPRDDIATASTIHELAAREPGALAVRIAPGSQAEPAVVWAILRALGKRIEQLGRTKVKVYWTDARRWLVAHVVTEVIVLCAQHLGRDTTDELEREICGGTGSRSSSSTAALRGRHGQRPRPSPRFSPGRAAGSRRRSAGTTLATGPEVAPIAAALPGFFSRGSSSNVFGGRQAPRRISAVISSRRSAARTSFEPSRSVPSGTQWRSP